jgi:hypothetical protein
MPVRWTTTAADDFTQVVERIRADNPAAAHRVAETIYKGIALLETLPNRGRIGRAEHTRELMFPPWPWAPPGVRPTTKSAGDKITSGTNRLCAANEIL